MYTQRAILQAWPEIDISAVLAEADAAEKQSDALLDRIDAAKNHAGSLKNKPRR